MYTLLSPLGDNGAPAVRGGREDDDVISAPLFVRACIVDVTGRDESAMNQFSFQLGFKYQKQRK